MGLVDKLLDKTEDWIARRLETESSGYEPFTPSDPETLLRILQPGDILLVEGNQKVSAAIKYLTQSTWSHAALFIGDALSQPANIEAAEQADDIASPENQTSDEAAEEASLPSKTVAEPIPFEQQKNLVEVEMGVGCIAVPLSKYQTYNTRICRPVNMTPEDRAAVVKFMVDHIGIRYDTRNILDLARYLFPTPPVPVRWRRRLIQLGSGEPTRAICSTLIAQAFQKVNYPILPRIEYVKGQRRASSIYSRREILHIRHHSLFTPRDFDLSPYFAILKPTIEYGFDYKRIEWAKPAQKPAKELPPSTSPSAEDLPATAANDDEKDASTTS